MQSRVSVVQLPPSPPPDEIADRVRRYQTAMHAAGIDAAVLVQSADLVYLSGTAQNAHLVVPAEGHPLLLVRRDLERARAESPLERIEPFTSLRALPHALGSLDIAATARIGFELDVIAAGSYLRYRSLLPKAEIVDCMPSLWAARSKKTVWEIERIRAACAQTEAAFARAPELIREGRPEWEVLDDLFSTMRRHGHEGGIRFRGLNSEFLFGQVLAGASAAVPGPTETPLHGPGLSAAQGRGVSRRLLQRGDAVVIDISGLSEGYVSDQTRTFFLGDPDREMLAAHESCRAILAACVPLLVAGTPASAIYQRGLEVAETAGYGKNFMGAGDQRVRFIGHCIGLELNEPPYLAHGWHEPLAIGNVVAIEPKLQFAGLGAVGVENSYLITADGPVQLTAGSDAAVVVEP